MPADAQLQPEALRAREAAALLGISESFLFQLDKAGRIPAPVRIGRCTRWRRAELLNWLAAGSPCRMKWKELTSRK